METEELVKKLSFKENRLYLDGNEILSIPGNKTCARINIVGVRGGSIYIGTGGCCHGYLFEMEKSAGESFVLDDFFSVDFNIFEMMPVVMRGENSLNRAMLVSGYGCAGSGIRIVSTYDARSISVISRDEYKGVEDFKPEDIGLDKTGFKEHRLNLDDKAGKISLDLYNIGKRVKSGMTRQAGVPEFLMTGEEEYCVSDRASKSENLTQRLERFGVDIPASLELARSFRKIYSKI